jgi:dTDP-4-amino-4,6-dideoxygalactose transaminase
MSKLAINGGPKIRNRYFPSQKVPDGVHGILSGYRGSWGSNFWGGKEVEELEELFTDFMGGVGYSIAVNSCTSALQIACMAIGLREGDEVIVTPWSMSCSATAPMICGATPVFADIEEDGFCLDVDSIESKITDRTKAIIVVDLFGQPYDVISINKLAAKHNLFVIEDAAQAIGSSYDGQKAGSFGHIGCFSFTQGKHLSAGEGGMIYTDNEELMMRCSLLRNHAEAVVNGMPSDMIEKYKHLVGFNMRMTEMQAMIIKNQISAIGDYIKYRRDNVSAIRSELSGVPEVLFTDERHMCEHTYYVLPFYYNTNSRVHRDKYIEAVKAELMEESNRIDRGVPINAGYIKPLYKFPIFQDRNIPELETVEKLQNEDVFITLYHGLLLEDNDINDICCAFKKVSENIKELENAV